MGFNPICLIGCDIGFEYHDPHSEARISLSTENQWVENKAAYTMTRDLLIETGCQLDGDHGCIEMSKLQSIDVEDPDDLEIAVKLLKSMVSVGKSWIYTLREFDQGLENS